MAITKNKKVEIIDEISNATKDSNSLVFVSFNKLNVADSTDLRRKLRAENVGYKVTKKTLLKRALESKNIEGEWPELPGEIALAYGEDLIAPARLVYEFEKSHKDNLSIVGGMFEGKFMDKSAMLSIATIPPLQVLYGQFVNLINSPIQRFAVVLNEIAKSKQ